MFHVLGNKVFIEIANDKKLARKILSEKRKKHNIFISKETCHLQFFEQTLEVAGVFQKSYYDKTLDLQNKPHGILFFIIFINLCHNTSPDFLKYALFTTGKIKNI